MQGAGDEVLREALDCFEDGAIEEGDLPQSACARSIPPRRGRPPDGARAEAPDLPRMRAM
jgi:hypothetical protein